MLDPKISQKINNALHFKTGLPLPICDFVANEKIIRHFAARESSLIKRIACACKGLKIDLCWNIFPQKVKTYTSKQGLEKYRVPVLNNSSIKKEIAEYRKNRSLFEPHTLLAYLDTGVLSQVHKYLGFETFCYAVKDNIKEVERIIIETSNNKAAFACEFVKNFAGGVYFIADDIAAKYGLFFSPKLLKKLMLPYLKRVVSILKKQDIKVIFHSDGDISAILKDLIDSGIDGIHPVEPVGAMQIEKIRRTYGKNLILMGGIDLYRGREEVLAAVKKNLKITKRCGYLVGSASGIGENLAPDFIIKLYQDMAGL